MQVLRGGGSIDRGRVEIRAEHPVGGAAAGYGEPIVFVLEVV